MNKTQNCFRFRAILVSANVDERCAEMFTRLPQSSAPEIRSASRRIYDKGSLDFAPSEGAFSARYPLHDVNCSSLLRPLFEDRCYNTPITKDKLVSQ